MFLTLEVVLLVLDDPEEDKNEADDAEKKSSEYQFKRGRIGKNGAQYQKNVGLHCITTGSVHATVFRGVTIKIQFFFIRTHSGFLYVCLYFGS
jgi:hypothetical protein